MHTLCGGLIRGTSVKWHNAQIHLNTDDDALTPQQVHKAFARLCILKRAICSAPNT